MDPVTLIKFEEMNQYELDENFHKIISNSLIQNLEEYLSLDIPFFSQREYELFC